MENDKYKCIYYMAEFTADLPSKMSKRDNSKLSHYVQNFQGLEEKIGTQIPPGFPIKITYPVYNFLLNDKPKTDAEIKSKQNRLEKFKKIVEEFDPNNIDATQQKLVTFQNTLTHAMRKTNKTAAPSQLPILAVKLRLADIGINTDGFPG